MSAYPPPLFSAASSAMPSPQATLGFYGPPMGQPMMGSSPGFVSAVPPQQMMFAAPNQLFGSVQPAVVSSQVPPMVQTGQQAYFPQQQIQGAMAPSQDSAKTREIAELHAKLQESQHKTSQLQHEINMSMADPSTMQTELQITALAQELIQLRTKAEALEEQCLGKKAEVDRQTIQDPQKMQRQFETKMMEMQKKESDLAASMRKYEQEKLMCQQRLNTMPDLAPEIDSMTKKLDDLKEKCRNLEDSCLKFQAERVDVMEMQRQMDLMQRQVFARHQDARNLEAHRVSMQIENEKLRAVLRGRSRAGQTRYAAGKGPPGADLRGQGLFYPPLQPYTYDGPGYNLEALAVANGQP